MDSGENSNKMFVLFHIAKSRSKIKLLLLPFKRVKTSLKIKHGCRNRVKSLASASVSLRGIALTFISTRFLDCLIGSNVDNLTV